MTVGMSVPLRNARLDAIETFVGSAPLLRIYDGTRPSTGGAVTTLLAELACNADFSAAASSGTLTLNAISNDNAANATGTASWARLVKSDGTTHCMDFSVTATGGGGDITVATVSFVANAVITMTSAVFTEGNP